MFNKIILMGRICSDPELKTTPNGTNVCTFRIAVDRRYAPKGEEKQTDFFNVAAWRQTGDFVNRYFGKGRMILVEGEMQTRQYTDKSGNAATWYEVNAERVSFTGEKTGDSSAQAGTDTNASAPAAPPADYSVADSDDDYPF